MTKRYARAAVQLGIGLLLVIPAVVLYAGYWQFTYELTFLSNFSAGVFFLIASIFAAKGSQIPQIWYLCVGVLLFLVMAVCLAFSDKFSFSGAFLFLHLINPLAVLAYFFIAADIRAVPLKLVPAALAAPFGYLVFALIFGARTGNYIYFFLDYNQVGVPYTIIFILIAAAGLLLVSGLLWGLNRLGRKKPET